MNYKYSDSELLEAIKAYSDTHNGAKFNPKAALIDMDGVLYDSMPAHATAWYKLCQDLHIESNRDERGDTSDRKISLQHIACSQGMSWR